MDGGLGTRLEYSVMGALPLCLDPHPILRMKANPVEAVTQEKMAGVTAGLPLPPGLKLPF